MRNTFSRLFMFIALSACVEGLNAHSIASPSDSSSSAGEVAWVVDRVRDYKTENDIPGVAIGVIKDGKPLLIQGFGVMQRGEPAPFNETSLIQIASVTKVMTGIVANRLIRESVIDPKESIVKYLGDLLSPEAQARLEPVTIEHLLHHRAGVPRDSVTPVRVDHNSPMLDGYSEEAMVADLNVMELAFTPGSKWEYSNFGYDILGYIFERKTGRSFEKLIQDYVAKPYGMKEVFIEPTERWTSRIATPYRKDDRRIETYAWVMGKQAPSGGVYTNIEGLLRLVGSQIQAYRSNAKTGTPSDLILTSRTASTEFGDPPMHYGYGLFQRATRYDHFGDLDGYGSDYRFSPELGLGVVAVTTSGGIWLDDMMDEIYADLLVQYSK
ncbi:MAG: serine hydrolase domain-containing protein [Parasphingorhabdus sp.]|uniref:serine hydrolase domain-containing protein n=1 Tax=Parasphingorhabdus sp. TaxID=2709688 RepID=UPI0032993F77